MMSLDTKCDKLVAKGHRMGAGVAVLSSATALRVTHLSDSPFGRPQGFWITDYGI